ncbi:glycosyltransferase family 4 protein [Desulfovibrio sp. OttesenSCG-928-C06]|nr:glycosyltransferase family 4 protein [Desulfovibrio sp. OttesenSCG-928-C06]
MNITIITHTRQGSGGARQALYQAQGLARAGHTVHFVSKPDFELRKVAPDLNWVDMPDGLCALNRTLRSLMPKDEPSVVHAFHNKAVKRIAYLGTLWRLKGLPVACFAHRGVTKRPGNPLPYLLPGIRTFVVNAVETGQALPLLWRKNRWRFVNNCIPASRTHTTQSVAEMRNEMNIADDRMVIGYVGYDKREKGAGQLLEAYAKVRQDLPPSNLVMVGLNHPTWPKMAEELGITADVRIIGRTERVADYVQTFDLLVFPSYFIESQPNVIMEAMSLGKPVIGSDIGNIKEMIGKEFTFKGGDVEQIAQKLVQTANDPALLSRMAADNLATSEKFSEQYRLDAILEIYRKALAEDGLV